MTISILRTADGWWVHTAAGAVRIDTAAATTGELLADRDAITAATHGGNPVPVDTLALLSPVTAPCRVVAQMLNFRSHAEDSGINPDAVPTAFFRKASGSISGPFDNIVKPTHVRFLDYEVEIGLVFGRDVPVGTKISAANLADYVAGLVVTNDVSARDLQLPKTQFYESKSYPTFTPVGPRLVLLDATELSRFADLRLQLWVNGQLRQDRTAADMIVRPVEALQVLTGFQQLQAGDLLLTGTPGGTALKAPPKPIEIIGSLLPAQVKWKAFFNAQAKSPNYLRDGDVVEVRVATDDGAIDLGTKKATVRYAAPPAR
jgi:2-keto-4-pentenoate hydratase/2-oxohepta-3-ene-1,7-dioic acid hydratase in catechol pathway